mgnify:FL=1
MCGRFSLTLDADEVRQALRLGEIPPDWQPRYNIAPSQPVAVVMDAETRDVRWMRWGLIPSWAKDETIGSRLINARAETLVEKPSFRSAFARRRCLILADGFYEWLRPATGKGRSQPYYFRLKSRKPFALAGLWETWRSAPEAQPLTTCTIITCAANAMVAPVHERMPVMLAEEPAWDWLTIDHQAVLRAMLAPFPPEEMEALPVERFVNDPAFDSPDCLKPADI